MKEILSKTIRIMGIYIFAMVIVSAVAFLANIELKKDRAQFIGFGDSEGVTFVIREIENVERTNTQKVEQNEDEKSILPFDFDVNVIAKTKRQMPLRKVQSMYFILSNNSTVYAFEELGRRKRYKISFCKIYHHKEKTCIFINNKFLAVILI